MIEQQKPAVDPGQQYGIIGIIMLVLGLPFVGIFLSIIGYKKSKRVGIHNTLAKVGIWLNAIFLVIMALLLVGSILVVRWISTQASKEFETAKKTVAAVELLQKTPDLLQGNAVNSVEEYVDRGMLPDGTKITETSTPNVGEIGYEKCESANGSLMGVKLYYLEAKKDNYISGSSNIQTQVFGDCN